uniref:Uncharacterized protein n=1 Tax=Anguilla anguilla TaxID=7936 RepID=A0A0E9U9A9_ANGAN
MDMKQAFSKQLKKQTLKNPVRSVIALIRFYFFLYEIAGLQEALPSVRDTSPR